MSDVPAFCRIAPQYGDEIFYIPGAAYAIIKLRTLSSHLIPDRVLGGNRMFQIFYEEKWITAAMLLFFGFSVFMQILLGFLYGSMIRETDNMAVTQNRLLRQCKLKFINCFQLNNGVSNVSVFVDKFLSRMALGPFSFESLYHFSGQTELLSVAAAGVGICKCIAEGRTIGQILPFYIACFIGLYLYFAISATVDVKGKRQILKVNLVDYLENHLSSKIGTTRDDLEMLHYIKPGKKEIEFMPIGKRMEMIPPEDEADEGERVLLESLARDGFGMPEGEKMPESWGEAPRWRDDFGKPEGEKMPESWEASSRRRDNFEKSDGEEPGTWENFSVSSQTEEDELEELLREFLASGVG